MSRSACVDNANERMAVVVSPMAAVYRVENIVKKMVGLAGLVLVLHVLAVWAIPSNSMAISYLFMLSGPLVAMVGCFRVVRRTGASVSWEWMALCLGLLLWEIGLAMAARDDLWHRNTSVVTAVEGFVYFLFGAPILFVICASPNERRRPAIIAIDGIMAIAIGVLSYRVIFSFLPGLNMPAQLPSATRIAFIYDAENLSLALLASIRLLAADSADEQLFYRTVCIFLWTYVFASGFYNHVAVIRWQLNTGHPVDAVVDIPFLLLSAITLGAPERAVRWSRIVTRSSTRLIQAGISFSLPLLLLGLGIVALAHSTVVGIVSIVGSLVGYGLRNTLFHARLLESEDELLESRSALEKAALIDPLTGIGNRRAFDRTLEQEWHRADRTKEPLALLFIDVDYFKRINDTHGHQRGDECLTAVASTLEGTLSRAGDFVARYGGEEFACILPATDGKGALEVGEKLRAAIEALQIEHVQGDHRVLTVSVGATACRGLARAALPTLLRTADKALYEAKRKGRNRVEFAVTESKILSFRAS
jgi:diguanylate cyclase (GGDEF)-like protein